MSNDLQPIIQRLDTLIKLIAGVSLSGKKKQEKIEFLSRIGLAPKEIAGLISTTPNTVRVTLTRMRKSNSKRGGNNGKGTKQTKR